MKKILRYIFTAQIIFILVFDSFAQQQQQQQPNQAVTLIRAGRVFDSENGAFLPARDIIVKGNLIESIGENLPVPKGASVIDLRKYTVLPGLIDAHTHLLYLENPKGNLSTEGIKAVTMEGAPLRALHGAARGKTFLLSGFTTIRDLGNSGRFVDAALRVAVLDGSADGPRMYVSGPGLSSEGGQFPGLQFGYRSIAEEEYRIIRGVDDARNAVRENVTYGANVIKIYANNTPNPTFLSMDEMKAIVEEAHLLRVKVAAHATSDVAVRRAVEAGVDSIEHGYQISDETLKLMAEKKVALVPTDSDVESFKYFMKSSGRPQTLTDEQIASQLKPQRERLMRAVAAGVTIVAGSDMYIDMQRPQGDAAKRVLFAYLESGMKPVQILQSATINAARLFNNPRLGVIKNGAFADIIAVEGNPADDFGSIEKVRFVMKNGKVYLEAR
ncbi:MAG TPA: amidohydrolase family protein [Pyrinomonadaceae bacterium]|jgi:imidazolonepropionase-like amidohydrolase